MPKSIIYILLLVISPAFGQVFDSLPDKDEKLDELPLKDRFGYFYNRNSVKYSPAIGAFGGGDLIMGQSFSFEYGGFGRKYSLNFTTRQYDGFFEYAKNDSLIVDSSTILKGIRPNYRFEIQPRFYYLENIGLYAGVHMGFIKNLDNKEVTLYGGFTSGLSIVFWEIINLDMSLAIHYDPTGIGSLGDVPVQLRPYAGLGVVFPIHEK